MAALVRGTTSRLLLLALLLVPALAAAPDLVPATAVLTALAALAAVAVLSRPLPAAGPVVPAEARAGGPAPLPRLLDPRLPGRPRPCAPGRRPCAASAAPV